MHIKRDIRYAVELIVFTAVFICMAMLAPVGAHASKGKLIYDRRCAWCHGKAGAGDGSAAAFLNPPPRDFTQGTYKWKTTPSDEAAPDDADFYKMAHGGMNGNAIPGWTGLNSTSMPGWSDMLSKVEIVEVISYIKELGKVEKNELPPVKAGATAPSTKESIEKGRKLFLDRCGECHGEKGRGDASKKLKDDWRNRTWPRDLTRAWTFRMGAAPAAIYTRITTGIAGTQMPGFADKKSKKYMTDEERFHVANFVASLDEPGKKPDGGNIIDAKMVNGQLPDKTDDSVWDSAAFTSFYLTPQIIAGDKLYTPTLNSVSVKALYNEMEIALLIEWDDPTLSLPGDAKSIELSDGEVYADGVAVQFPAAAEGETGTRPYFGMGDRAREVNIWHWQNADGADKITLMNARGFNIPPELRDAAGLKANGVYDNGRWRVVMKRARLTVDASKDAQFRDAALMPVAFAAWDGTNQEKGSRHTMTEWSWLRLKTKAADRGVYVWPIAVGVFVFAIEMAILGWVRKT